MHIYLCGPIWHCTESEAVDWRKASKDIYDSLYGEGCCLDPLRRDYQGTELESIAEIVVLDKLDIRNSDVLLVCFSQPSVGTSMEVFYAWTLGRPTVVVNVGKRTIPPWMIYHATVVVDSFADAYSWIQKQIGGVEEC